MSRILKPEVAPKLIPALQPSRYKALYGGRSGAKSHFFATLLVMRCVSAQTRAVCVREVQNSIRDSVRQLLIDKIRLYGLDDQFEILEHEIRGPHGSLIIFRGMQNYNAENIKSLEAFDVLWFEEAQTCSALSLRMIRPTIRKAGSEMWFSWNPRHDDDAVDMFFRGPHPPPDAIIINVGWQDNPWLTAETRAEIERDYAADREMADHVWGGGYLIVAEGAYFARLMAKVEDEGRIGRFPYLPAVPVDTGWDLGVDDYTAIWFTQNIGNQIRVLDYHEFSGIGAQDIVAHCMPEMLPDADDAVQGLLTIGRTKPYLYGRHFLPHDLAVREWGNRGVERGKVLQSLGLKNIVKGVRTGPEERISATREVLPHAVFDNTGRVALGIKRLRRYSRKLNQATGEYMGPAKDGNDHGADAFGELALNCEIRHIKKPEPQRPAEFTGGVRIGPPEQRKRRRIA